jgi:hypothetical protein
VTTLEEMERQAAQLRDVTATIYAALGTAATTVTDDRACLRLHVASRRAGAMAADWRAVAPHRAAALDRPEGLVAPLLEACTLWETADPSGQLLVLALVAEVTPRLLVTLRDVATQSGPGSAPTVALASRHAALLVVDHQQLGVALREETPPAEELAVPLAAGAQVLDAAGFGESFGPNESFPRPRLTGVVEPQ